MTSFQKKCGVTPVTIALAPLYVFSAGKSPVAVMLLIPLRPTGIATASTVVPPFAVKLSVYEVMASVAYIRCSCYRKGCEPSPALENGAQSQLSKWLRSYKREAETVLLPEKFWEAYLVTNCLESEMYPPPLSDSFAVRMLRQSQPK